ncbi:MAG: LacI family DNA-binding transcriptional regulator [Bellilinea sp.]
MNKSKKNTTIRDVAHFAGVSVATISRYLNHTAPLSDETAQRVQAAMTELDFSPHPVARSLATNRTNTIGLVLNKIEGEFFTPLLEGIIATTETQDFNLLIFTTNQSKRLNSKLLGSMYTDGLLVFLDSLDNRVLTALHESEQPIVLIHRTSPPGLNLPLVTIENKTASRGLVNHLIETHKRQRITFLRGPKGNEDSYWREIGYRQALESHNLSVDENLIVTGNFDRFTSQESIHALIRAGTQFDAVFTGDDESAVGVLTALKEAGIRVPEEVSVVGFDDQRLAPFLNPPLTTIHAPTDQVGIVAAQQLIKLMRRETIEREILLPTELILRNSCGCK